MKKVYIVVFDAAYEGFYFEEGTCVFSNKQDAIEYAYKLNIKHHLTNEGDCFVVEELNFKG